MITYWQNLNERERWMVILAALATLIYLFYWLIYSPLVTAISDKTNELKEKEQTLVWMKTVSQENLNTKNKQSINNSKLLALIDSKLSSSTFKQFPYQLQQTGPGDIQLSYERVPYNEFLQWLWQLNDNYLINLKQIIVEKTDTTGVTKISIILSSQ